MIKSKIKLIGFEYVDERIVTEIRRNLQFLFATREGSCPGDRAYGLNWDAVDKPMPEAENIISLSIYDKVEKYEPRVIVDDISFSHKAVDGSMYVTITVRNAEE